METRTHLNEIRQSRGISAAALAKLSGVTRQTIYAIEAGDYVPNTTVALQLAKILEVRVEELFLLADDYPAPQKSVPVDLIFPARAGQPVQLCRVGNRMIGVPATPQYLMLPTANAVVVDGAKAQLLPGEVEDDKRLLIAGMRSRISLLSQHLDIIALLKSTSHQALEWLKRRSRGKVHVAGTHLRRFADGRLGNLPVIKAAFSARRGEGRHVRCLGTGPGDAREQPGPRYRRSRKEERPHHQS